MPSGGLPLSRYDFVFFGGSQFVYLFESQFGAGYQIKFKPSGYLVDDPALQDFVFELVIVLADNPFLSKLPPADSLLSATIAAITADFLEKHERVVLYICDDSDSRADSRRKLFDRWFDRYKKSQFIKLDVPLAVDEHGIAYSVELIARLDNPYFTAVFESFKRAISATK